MRKPTICICKNKDADQLRSNCEADHRLCFRYSDSTIPLLLKSEISSFYLCLYRPVCVGPVRKPHCWFSHEAAHLNLKDEKYQKREKYDPRHDKTGFLPMRKKDCTLFAQLG